MYEHRKQKLLPWRQFLRRVARHGAIAGAAILCSLVIGVAGYSFLGGLGLVDSILNAAMILGGMGPVDKLTDTDAKLFAAGYALFSGLIFIGVVGILLAPFAHRLFHKLHLESEDDD